MTSQRGIRTAKVVNEIKRVGFRYSTKGGMSIAVDDVIVSDKKDEIIALAQTAADSLERQYQRGLVTDTERIRELEDIWSNARDTVTDDVKSKLHGQNSVWMMMDSGAKGNINQVSQQVNAVIMGLAGAGRIFAASTNAFINTGDGLGMTARAGLPLEDMEFWQFHPTGVAGAGVLITEGVRGEGGILLNCNGERFMERYAPTLKDLAPRDFVSRSMDQEIKEGRGCGPDKDYVLLKLDHLGAETIRKRLPSVEEIGHNFANVDITREPIPVVPTIHYQMGGIPTNINGQVVVPNGGVPNAVVNGLYAVGECSCVSVHGANRLGTNSLLDLLVFGRAAGNHIVEFNNKNKLHKPLPANAADTTLARLSRLDNASSGEYAQDVANDIRASMQKHAGVFRTQASMDEGVVKIADLRKRVENINLQDKSKVFNTARIEALEVENLIEAAQATIVSAAARHESRGAHTVNDYSDSAQYPNGRNDNEWHKHTLWYREGNRLSYKPVQMKPLTVESVPLKTRTF